MLPRKSQNSCHGTRGFTLIELLVVIAILVAVFMPALGRARDIARKRVCQTRLSSIHTAAIQRSADNWGYVAQPGRKNCWVATKADVQTASNASPVKSISSGWGSWEFEEHWWAKAYPKAYMGEKKAQWDDGKGYAALQCPSQICPPGTVAALNVRTNALPKNSFKRQQCAYGGSGVFTGYGMAEKCWDKAETMPLRGGKWMYHHDWRPGPGSVRKFPIRKTYVRGLQAVSNLVAFGDVTHGDISEHQGNGGFRHDGGAGPRDWYRNVVFWDGHVGDYKIDTHKDKRDPYWKDTKE
jgi:prepilin-type N-terminal cleavage/methylation domain-containing protein/prepilin-type processing-associated H-X9-DG protein